MESNSTKNRVQLSEQTAELLFKVNKGHWLIKRTDKVNAKGKGNLQTYWLDVKTKRGSIAGSVLDPDENSPDEDSPDEIQDDESLHGTDVFEDATNVKRLSSRHIRLVDWNVECLVQLLRKIAVRREAKRSLQADSQPEAIADDCTNIGTVLDEVKECIEIPEFHPKVERMNQDVGSIELNEHVKEQLRDYVTTICCMYKNNNHFHNFEHASHVAM